MGWECVVPGKEIEDVSKDRKNSKRFELYDISEKAVYFQGLNEEE